MCGRFVNHSSLSKIEETFNVDTVTCEVSPNYNIAPSQEVLAVVRHTDTRLGKLHWGLVPAWSKDLGTGPRLINARSETVSKKPSFRNVYKNRRCLIVADGFYEWQGEKGAKQPFFITTESSVPLGFAGLWEIWKKEGETEYRSCTIITTTASPGIKKIHHRMPAIVKPEFYDTWLDPRLSGDKPDQILNEGIVRDFDFHPVSKRVNSVLNNDPSCIEPVPAGRE